MIIFSMIPNWFLDYNAMVGKINDHEYILVSTQKIKAQAYLNQCFLVLQIQAQQ